MVLETGTQLGPYRIISPLGKGGMGEVYVARDSRLHREVAVKVLPEPMSKDPEALKRFEREARALAALSHPSILTIFDFNTEQGVSYAVMELLEGETLRAMIQRAPVTWEKSLEIAGAIAEGLSAAHSKGVIHRDLKPENIFLTADGRVKILDFGLVRWKHFPPLPEKIPTTTETEPGMVLGTIQYMSPEQIRGNEIDPRSDLFSLGCLFYEMLSGKNPFARETTPETLAAILRDDPPLLSACVQDIPSVVEETIMRLLEKDPDKRFPSAAEAASAWKAIITTGSGRNIAAAWPTRFRAFRYWLIAAVVVTVLVVVLVRGNRKPFQSIAVLPLANASSDANAEYLSDGISENIINSLSQIPQLRVIARTTAFRYKGMEADPQEVGSELDVDAVLTGKVTWRGDSLTVQADLINAHDGSQLWGRQYYRKFSDLLSVQEEIARDISENLRIKLTGEQRKRLTRHYTENTEAYQLYLKGRYYWNKRTGEGFRKGIEYFNQAIDMDPDYALAYIGLADCYALLSAYSVVPPHDAIPPAKAAIKKALELDKTLPEAHASLGLTAFLYDWNWDNAENEFKQAIHLNPSYPTAHHWYGEFLIARGRSQEAVAELEKARNLDPLSMIINTDIGRAYFYDRRYDQAIEQFKKTLDLDPTFVQTRVCLGMTYEQKSLYPQAIAEFEKTFGTEADRRGNLLLGHLYAVTGDKLRTEKIIMELTEISSQGYVSPYSFALLYTGLGRKDEAFQWLNKAFDDRSEWLAYLNVDPRLDPLRRDPRFTELLQRVRIQ